MQAQIPVHLNKYIVKQDLKQYSAKDQAVWRFTMRQLVHYLKDHAHSSYLEGIKKTGIEIEEIPSISSINEKLNKFGWGAVPVSGFIPPTAFMEFQSLGYLPIASSMRTLDHLLYTPAPDIIHEAAGHAPIIINDKFSSYLKKYAEVAKKALFHEEDILLYQAIRELSDIKEHPNSTAQEIQTCEKKLNNTIKNMGSPSEAALLGRMNWWTAEYGLIKQDGKNKIFGAGLLSSLGESENCLKDLVKKIPISLDCINYSYDITEEQPQLFTTNSFQELENVLEQFSDTMAFKVGGALSVDKAIKAKTINTIELNSGVQISGVFEKQITETNKCYFLKTNNPTQLSYNYKELQGHNKEFHEHGYSTIVDTINGSCLSDLNETELSDMLIIKGKNSNLNFDNGFNVIGDIKDFIFKQGRLILIKFINCTVTYKNETYFQPDWGDFDLAIGSSVTSVFSGAADSEKYGELYNFEAQVIPQKIITERDTNIFEFYKKIRDLRNKQDISQENITSLTAEYIEKYPKEWLAGVEIIEIMYQCNQKAEFDKITNHLLATAKKNKSIEICTDKGLKLAKHIST